MFNADCDPKLLSPLTLAFVGDCVFELFVRERLVCAGNCPVNALHKKSVAQVCSSAQALSVQKILPVLTQDEAEVLKRGRNAHTNHVPKNSSQADYHAATGFETLFGFLYLAGQIDRLRELFRLICEESNIKE